MTFRVKPGFKAVEKKKEVFRRECKKKVLIRGRGESMLACPTRYGEHVVCVLSRGDRADVSFLKLFYLSKFYVMIKQSKLFEQVPRKITRLLQEQAKKNKYGDKVL